MEVSRKDALKMLRGGPRGVAQWNGYASSENSAADLTNPDHGDSKGPILKRGNIKEHLEVIAYYSGGYVNSDEKHGPQKILDISAEEDEIYEVTDQM